jgi:hypothetical protein
MDNGSRPELNAPKILTQRRKTAKGAKRTSLFAPFAFSASLRAIFATFQILAYINNK